MTPKIRSSNRFQWGRTLAAAALISLVVSAIVCFHKPTASVSDQPNRPFVEQEASPAIVSNSASPGVASSAVAPGIPKQSIAAEVDRLVATHNPTDAFAAYRLIRNCMNARRDQLVVAEWAANNDKSKVPSVSAACGDLSPGQVASRNQYLSLAAKAGINGAAGALAEEGPRGDGVVMSIAPDDAEQAAYIQAVKEAVAAGAAAGDYWSLLSMSNSYDIADSGKPDYVAALKYFVAADDAYKRDHGKDFNSFKGGSDRYKAFIPAEQAAGAIQAGHDFFRNTQGGK